MGLGGIGARGVEEGGGNLKGVAFIDIKGGGLIVLHWCDPSRPGVRD